MFLRNAWYVVAWDCDVARTLLPLTVLGDRIVLYRTTRGTPVALEDACVHRKLPLSLGRLVDDEVECGYHGLVYDFSGRCTRIPGAKHVPGIAKVRSYPAVSRYGLVWVWMGDPMRADPASIFEVEHCVPRLAAPVVRRPACDADIDDQRPVDPPLPRDPGVRT